MFFDLSFKQAIEHYHLLFI